MLETADALNGILEAPRETNESVGMATRHLEPAEETLGYLALLGFVVRRVWDTRADAASNEELTKNERRGSAHLTVTAWKMYPFKLIEVLHAPLAASQLSELFASVYLKLPSAYSSHSKFPCPISR